MEFSYRIKLLFQISKKVSLIPLLASIAAACCASVYYVVQVWLWYWETGSGRNQTGQNTNRLSLPEIKFQIKNILSIALLSEASMFQHVSLISVNMSWWGYDLFHIVPLRTLTSYPYINVINAHILNTHIWNKFTNKRSKNICVKTLLKCIWNPLEIGPMSYILYEYVFIVWIHIHIRSIRG